MPTIVGILTFMNMINFTPSWLDHKTSFIASGPDFVFHTRRNGPTLHPRARLNCHLHVVYTPALNHDHCPSLVVDWLFCIWQTVFYWAPEIHVHTHSNEPGLQCHHTTKISMHICLVAAYLQQVNIIVRPFNARADSNTIQSFVIWAIT